MGSLALVDASVALSQHWDRHGLVSKSYRLPFTYMVPYRPDRVVIQGDKFVEEGGKQNERIRESTGVELGSEDRLNRTLHMLRKVEAYYRRAGRRRPPDKESDLVPFPAVLDRLGIVDRGVWNRHTFLSVNWTMQRGMVSGEAGFRSQPLVRLLDDEARPVI